jgi:hypothetical protein
MEDGRACARQDGLGSLAIGAVNPEFDVTVIPGDPADPRVQAPAAEEPRGTAGHSQRMHHQVNDTELRQRSVLHDLSLT